MTAAVLGGIWLVLRLPDWLGSLVALVRRRRAGAPIVSTAFSSHHVPEGEQR